MAAWSIDGSTEDKLERLADARRKQMEFKLRLDLMSLALEGAGVCQPVVV